MCFVPEIFMATDNLRASSNLTVAAEWKTTETLSIIIFVSVGLIPKFGLAISPDIAAILYKASGRSLRSQSKIYKIKIIKELIISIQKSTQMA